METYLRAAVERAMKVQEVIMRAMARKITWGWPERSSDCANDRCVAGNSAIKRLATLDLRVLRKQP